jgi:hypothetical protein
MGREWGGDGNGEISLRATWDQGGRDPITARRVPSTVSKGNERGAKRNEKREKQKARGLRHKYVVHSIFMYIVIACNCLNDCQSVYVCIIIADMNVIDNLNCV